MRDGVVYKQSKKTRSGATGSRLSLDLPTKLLSSSSPSRSNSLGRNLRNVAFGGFKALILHGTSVLLLV